MSRNIFKENQINLREMNDIVACCARNKISLLIYGGPGLGKSQKIQQLADKMFGVRHPGQERNVVDFRLADKEPSDVAGHQIPVEVDGKFKTVYAVPDFWPADPNWEGFIFMDELLNAEPYLQNVAFQIMLDRRIGTYEFPKGAVMVGAGNRDGDGGATHAIVPALANRMMIVELEYDATVFIEDYAIPYNVHTNIIGLLKTRGDFIENYVKQCVEQGSPSFTTPRSLAQASKILYERDADLINDHQMGVMLQGLVGKMTSDALILHRRNSKLPQIRKILSGEVTVADEDITDDMQFILGLEGTRILREEIMKDARSDEEILLSAKNFLTYLHTNFAERNADFVMSVFLKFLNKSPEGEALLKANPLREKLIPKMANNYEVVMEIINKYHDEFSKSVAEAKKSS